MNPEKFSSPDQSENHYFQKTEKYLKDKFIELSNDYKKDNYVEACGLINRIPPRLRWGTTPPYTVAHG